MKKCAEFEKQVPAGARPAPERKFAVIDERGQYIRSRPGPSPASVSNAPSATTRRQEWWHLESLAAAWREYSVPILWMVLSCLVFWGCQEIQGRVNQYSLVWWLAGAVTLASLPGVIAVFLLALYIIFWFGVVGVVLGLIFGAILLLIELVKYFIANPW